MSKILELQKINKAFGNQAVLHDVSLSAEQGEFITLLGPSGCGKTTLLRIIAGLESADSGKVFLGGADVTDAPPNKRSVNTVFQNYALFPHMTVEENIGYGLKIRGMKKKEIRAEAARMIEMVRLTGEEKKLPSQLSGGQKQRVAIARAAVNRPDVLLLDEPLGALDLQLRRYLQGELKRIQRELGMTFIYITHDQEEAMNMSDRIVVMNRGRFEQTGDPCTVYDRPRTAFAAAFVGMANLLSCTVMSLQDGRAEVLYCGYKISVCAYDNAVKKTGDSCLVCVRGENIRLTEEEMPGSIPAVVLEYTYTNGILRIRLEITPKDGGAPQMITASRQGAAGGIQRGARVYAVIDERKALIVEDNIRE